MFTADSWLDVPQFYGSLAGARGDQILLPERALNAHRLDCENQPRLYKRYVSR
jgi:hypothetical protein